MSESAAIVGVTCHDRDLSEICVPITTQWFKQNMKTMVAVKKIKINKKWRVNYLERAETKRRAKDKDGADEEKTFKRGSREAANKQQKETIWRKSDVIRSPR